MFVLTAAQTAAVDALSFEGTRAAVEFEFADGGRYWVRGTDCASVIAGRQVSLDNESIFLSDVDCYCSHCVRVALTFDRRDREDWIAFGQTVARIAEAHRWFDER